MQTEAIPAVQSDPNSQTAKSVPENPASLDKNESVVAERAALIHAYKRECEERGIKVTNEMIAKAASPKWNERTPMTQWKRNDPACSQSDDRKIRAVLTGRPHSKSLVDF